MVETIRSIHAACIWPSRASIRIGRSPSQYPKSLSFVMSMVLQWDYLAGLLCRHSYALNSQHNFTRRRVKFDMRLLAPQPVTRIGPR
jgi:hypothetical protein